MLEKIPKTIRVTNVIDPRGTVNPVSTSQRKRKTRSQSLASSPIPQVDGDDRHLSIESERDPNLEPEPFHEPEPSFEPEPVHEPEPEPSLETEPDHEPEPSPESNLEPSLEPEHGPEHEKESEKESERYFLILKTLKYHCDFVENLRT